MTAIKKNSALSAIKNQKFKTYYFNNTVKSIHSCSLVLYFNQNIIFEKII